MIHGGSVRMNTRGITWGFLLLNPKVLFRGEADSPFSFFCLLHTQAWFPFCFQAAITQFFSWTLQVWSWSGTQSFVPYCTGREVPGFMLLLTFFCISSFSPTRTWGVILFTVSTQPSINFYQLFIATLFCVTTTQNSVTKTIHLFNSWVFGWTDWWFWSWLGKSCLDYDWYLSYTQVLDGFFFSLERL